MAKSAFDDNVSRVRPRLRLGRSDADAVTDPPPVRPDGEPDAMADAAATPAAPEPDAPPEPRRRSLVRDLIAATEEITHPEQHAAAPDEPAPAAAPVTSPADSSPEPSSLPPAPDPAPVEPAPVAVPVVVADDLPLAIPVMPATEELPLAVPVAPAALAPPPAARVEIIAPPAPRPTASSLLPRAPAPRPPPAPPPPAPAPIDEAYAWAEADGPTLALESADVPSAWPPAPPPPAPAPAPVAAPSIAAPPPPTSPPLDDAESATRRASLKRRAAGLGALPEELPPAPVSSVLDELDALENAAELAAELERALDRAAEANELLRKDLGVALDDLARSTAENKRQAEKVDRLEGDARDRARVVQDLVREMELLEGERDGALAQVSEAQLEIESLGERALLTERRVHELERSLADAQARTKRFEEAAQAQAAQRAALRAELEGVRRERDQLLIRTAELEREREELGRSRRALDEVHRALSDARARAQRIRPR